MATSSSCAGAGDGDISVIWQLSRCQVTGNQGQVIVNVMVIVKLMSSWCQLIRLGDMNIEYRGEEKVVVTASTRRLSEVHRVNMKTERVMCTHLYCSWWSYLIRMTIIWFLSMHCLAAHSIVSIKNKQQKVVLDKYGYDGMMDTHFLGFTMFWTQSESGPWNCVLAANATPARCVDHGPPTHCCVLRALVVLNHKT